MTTITVTEWTEQEFAQAREAWNRLLHRSHADPLFMSWEWQYTWWQTFAHSLSLELVLLTAYDERRELVGLAPLYKSKERMRGGITVRRLQFLGNCWRGPATMRTEHVDFLACRELAAPVIARFLEHIDRLLWDEWILADLRKDSPTYRMVQSEFSESGYVRQAESGESYYIDTHGKFSDYVAALGRNTRLRLYNRRSHAAARGPVRLDRARSGEIGHYFEMLNRLHRLRWNRDAFQANRLAFNRRVAELLAEEDRLEFSLLSLNDAPVSILYNLSAGGQVYNIQGGFDEAYDRKLALGYLHLGYAIEQAFAAPEIQRFNLLLGPGKHTQYKTRLTASHHQVVDLQVIRPRVLRAAYRAYDAYRHRRAIPA